MNKILAILLILVFSVSPVLAHHRDAIYEDADGYYYHVNACGQREYYSNDFTHKIHKHKRRRNVLLGVGALGIFTRNPVLTGIGIGGAAANELIDKDHRDYNHR